MCYTEHRYHEGRSRKKGFPGKPGSFSSAAQGRNCLSRSIGIGRIQYVWWGFFPTLLRFRPRESYNFQITKESVALVKQKAKDRTL